MKQYSLRYIAFFSSMLFVAGIALMSMTGWFTHNLDLIQLSPSFRTMKFNTALSFLSCAVAVIGLGTGRFRITRIAAGIVAFIGGATVLEYITGTNPGLDTLFVTPFTDVGRMYAYPGRMVPGAAFSFLLVGTSILLCSYASVMERYRAAIAFACCTAIAFGAVPVIEFMTGMSYEYMWGKLAEMAVHSAICLILIGVCVMGYVWKESGGSRLWLPVPLCVCLLTITISLSATIYRAEDQAFDAMIISETDRLGSVTETRFTELYNALGRIAVRWQAQGGTPKAIWEADTGEYVKDYHYIAALEWLDQDLVLRWVQPQEGNEKLVGQKLNQDGKRLTAVNAAISKRKIAIVDGIDLLQGGKGIVYYHPLYIKSGQDKKFDGMLVAAIRLDPFFAPLMERRRANFYVTIYSGNDLVFSTLPAQGISGAGIAWQKSAVLKNTDKQWKITLIPTQKLLASRNSAVPITVLVAGVISSLLISLCVFLALKWNLNNRRLQEMSRLNETILSGASFMIIATDLYGKVISFNKAAEKLLGYSASEIVGKQTPALWHDKGEIIKRAAELTEQLGVRVEPGFEVFVTKPRLMNIDSGEWTFIRKNGSRFPVNLTVTILRDGDNAITGYLGIIEDITQRKAAEEALRTSEETFRSAMKFAPTGFALVRPDGRWMKVNPSICNLLGYTEDELLARNFQSVTHADDLDHDLEYVQQLLAGKITHYHMEKRYVHKDGHAIWVLLSVSLVRTQQNNPAYFIAQVQDITGKKNAEATQQQLIDKLNESNTELERFAYVASHDMQEPLRMIANFSGIIADEYGDKFDGEGKEYLSLVTESALRMQKMVADLLEYARVGKDAMRPVDIDLTDEMKHVLVNLSRAISDKTASVTYDTLPHIKGNPIQITSLLQNLISNGLKYQAAGTVPEVHVGVREEGDFWRFSIKDNGIGMEKSHIRKIFEPFVRLHSWQQYKGSGIGLAVCKKIVENHGGKIWVESVPGKGSTFYFTIPRI